jgi:hypothetical protein
MAFVLGFKYPASMGAYIPNETVLETLNADVEATLPKVASIKIYEGNNEYKTITNTSTVLAKGLISYTAKENPENAAKYYTFTDKYQLAALSKLNDKDEEAVAIADFLDHTRAQITLEVAFK